MKDWKERLEEIMQERAMNNPKPEVNITYRKIILPQKIKESPPQIKQEKIQRKTKSKNIKKPTSVGNESFDNGYFHERLSEIYGSNNNIQQKKPTPPKRQALPESSFILAEKSTPITDNSYPHDWVNEGKYLQSKEGGTGRILPIKIGIDFGTAYTKCALRITDKIFFVSWDGLCCNKNNYLLSGELSIFSNGETKIGNFNDSHEKLNNIKLPFISLENITSDNRDHATVYLAWIMKYARAWLYKNHSSLIGNRKLVWEVNIGTPTSAASSTTIQNEYEKVGYSAWHLSQKTEITIENARKSLLTKHLLEEIQLDGLNQIPEFLAQIMGYVKSPQRQDGLHLLVDVGAGTIDIAMFNIFNYRVNNKDEGEDKFPIFANAVKPLGTHFFMKERLDSLQHDIDSINNMENIPSAKELAKTLSVETSTVEEIDIKFRKKYLTPTIIDVITHTKKTRDPRSSGWTKGIQTLLSGGGSLCEVYKKATELAFDATPRIDIKLPLPENIEGNIKPNDFHRLSVAYGLTYDKDDIGKILSPNEIEDFSNTSQENRYKPDRDEIYAK